MWLTSAQREFDKYLNSNSFDSTRFHFKFKTTVRWVQGTIRSVTKVVSTQRSHKAKKPPLFRPCPWNYANQLTLFIVTRNYSQMCPLLRAPTECPIAREISFKNMDDKTTSSLTHSNVSYYVRSFGYFEVIFLRCFTEFSKDNFYFFMKLESRSFEVLLILSQAIIYRWKIR